MISKCSHFKLLRKNSFSRWKINVTTEKKFLIDINQWYTALAECFCENLMIAIRKLNEIWYSQQNVCNDILLNNYVAWVLWLAEISYTNTQQVLLVIYKDFKVKIQHDIKMLTSQITKKEFIQQMKNQHHNWKKIFNQYCYNNQENDFFWVKNCYYHAVRNQVQTFQ